MAIAGAFLEGVADDFDVVGDTGDTLVLSGGSWTLDLENMDDEGVVTSRDYVWDDNYYIYVDADITVTIE